ncbi:MULTISPECIES: asparaginase [unclassified Pseudomonas]|uniref:asparaginase n=1 Tax=unclassified Pseudomonas TaxID=196821 RepID=UPI0006D41737|nr:MULTISPECIES: asparaginase [unclassified Pseudomonas]
MSITIQSSSFRQLFTQKLLAAAMVSLLTGFVVVAPAYAQEKPMSTTNQQAALPRALLLATGGTIAGSADNRGSGAYNAGAIGAQQLVSSVAGLGDLATLSAEQVASIGSQDMSDDIWLKLASRIQKALDEGEADAVVITHGTDTMEETAFFLSLVLKTDKPVVLVGSMRPATALGADGPANIYEAVQVAVDKQSKGRGVMVVMNDQIDSARGVTKTHSTSVQTMQSPNLGSHGYVDLGHIRFVKPAVPGQLLQLPEAPLPRVEIIYSHSNMDALQIEHAIADKAKGIILAGMGDGNTSKAALAALEKAAAQGIVVVRSTRVSKGYVNRNVEVDDSKSGFVASMDLNPQKARVLTQLLIANGVTDPQKVQEAFLNGH